MQRTVKSTNKKRKEWISDNTWKTIEERRILKNKENSAHSERQKEKKEKGAQQQEERNEEIIKSREKERN